MSPDPLAELLRERFEQLDRRLDDHHASLRERIERAESATQELTSAIFARLDAHEEYHRANEHRWGLFALILRYPLRSAMTLVVFLAALGPLTPDAAERLIRFIVSLQPNAP